MGLPQLHLFHGGLEIHMSATNGFLHRHRDTSYQEKGTHQPSQTIRLAIQGMVMNCHSLHCQTRPLGSCHFFLGLPRDARNETILGEARWIGGLTKVAIYPMCTNSHQKNVVLATLIQGPRDTGWQVTWLMYKQLKHTNSGYPR